jgi:sec-independent protein translocase protein TatA
MFGVGPMEMMIVGFIALLLFGKRLPEVAKSLGKGIVEFKKGVAGIEEDINDNVRRPASQPPQSRPLASDDRSEPTAPKFEPPKFD